MSISDFNLTWTDEQGIKMDLEYTSKFEEMKKYIPLLENMIKKLESMTSPVNLRQAQLDKIRSLRDLLLDNKKGMNLEILLKCEQVLINLYGKLEQNKLLPAAIKGGSESEFSIDSPTPKEKSDLEVARNKLKVSEKIKDTLPEIARACEVQEECTSGPKEPALFQRRPNTFLLSPSNNYQRKIIEETKTSEISKPKRNYTRVLISPENNSRRSFDSLREPINRSSAYRSLFRGRSSRKSPKSYSRERSCSYYKSERRKSSKDSCSRKSFKDTRSSSKASLSRKSFKESFSRKSYMHISDVKMNTNDTLPGIVKCNRDVDMDVLEELREQIIGELQKTPSLDSEVLANSDVNKLELQQSENELIELSDISMDSVEYISDQKNVDQSEKLLDNVNNDVQISLVITSTKNQSDNTPTVTDNLTKNDNTLTCNNYKCKEKPELNVGDISHNSDKLQISNKMVQTHLVESEHNLVLPHLENKLDISSKASDNLDNLDLQKNLNITQTQSKATTIPLNSTMDSSEVFVSTFEKYTSEMLAIKKNIHNTQIQPNNIEHAEITEESLNKYNATPMVLKNNEFSIEEKLEQMEGSAETLLSKPTVTQEYTEKIIQALKNEILGEIVSIPETATMRPRLPISKDVKTTSVQENMHKKRISFEKYKENIAKLTKPYSFPNKSSHSEVIASVNAPTKADIVNNYVVDMNSSTFASFTCNISSPFSKGIRDPSADTIFKVAKNIGRFSENIMMNDDQKIPFLDSCESLSSSGSVQVSIPYAIQPKQTPIASTATSVVTHQVQSYKITQCYQTGEIQLCDNVDSKSKICSRKWDLNNVSSNDIQEDKKRISKADCPQTSLLFEKADPPVALSQMFEPLNPLPLVRDNCLTTPSHSRSDFIPTPSNVTELIDWLRKTNPSFRTYTDKNEYNSKLKLSSIHSSTCPLTPNNIFGGSDFALTTNISVKLPKTDINNFNQDSGFNRDIEYESSSQVNEKKQEKKQPIQTVTHQNYERETIDSDDKFKNHTEDRVSLVSKDEKIYESRSSTFSDYKNNKTSLYSNKQSCLEIESSVYHNEKVVSSEQDDNKHCFLSKESSIERTQFKDITTTSSSINLINSDSLPETISSTVNSDEIIAASTSKECPLADSSNENSKINVTSLDPLESKTKEVSLNSKKGELTLTSVATLLSILQNKSKLKEVLNKLDSDFKENEKIKKTLKKITKVMSDVDDDMANDTEKEHTKYKGEHDFRTGVKDDNLLKKSGEVLNPIKESYENVEVKEIDTESYKNTMKEGYENIEDKKSDTKIDKKSVNKRCELEVNDKSRPQSKSKSKQLKMKVINNVEKRTRVSGANPILSTPVALNLSCELLKLQKSTKEIFLKENTLNSRGKSVLCNEDKNAGAFQEPVVILKKLEDMESTKNDKFYLDIEKKKYKYSTPKVKIRSLSPTHEPETIVPSKYKPISKSIKTLTKEHVTTNAGKANQINAGNDDQLLTHELSCTSSIIFSSVDHSNNAKKKIKRRCSSWQAGKIKRKQKKKNTVSKMVECQQIKEDTLKNQDSDINIFVDRTYCFRKNVFTYKCQLCPYVGKNIVHHYRGEHPHNEIPISRMAPMLAKKAIRLCTEIDFKTMNTISCEKYVCIFCSKEYSTGTKSVLKTFFWHIVKTHTGEYMQTCTECENVGNCPLKLHIPAPPSDVDRELKGYICKICNFTQISLENLKTHMILRHNDQQAEFYEINLSIISEKILKALLYRCDHESKPSLSMKYEDVVPKNTGIIEDNVVNTPTKELIHASDDIIDYPHFKIRFTKSGAKEYVCCINRQEKHYKATLLISLKKHVQKHSENWDGYCYVCKVIVTPQGMHSFIDCLEHYLGMHMDNFPVLENEFASHSIDVQESTKNITLNESNIGLCTLSKSVTKEEHLPKITNVVSLGAPNAITLETYQANINELVVKRQCSYEDVQAKIMLSKHRVILDSMLCREKLIKLFKCAGRFCSFTTDLFEDAILHASTHQRMGGIDAFICSYCNFDSDGKPTELVTHVFETHGNCLYSCGRCFYRAAASQLVGAHMSRIHSTTSQEVVLRATVRSSTEAVITELSREHVQYFVCGHNDPNGKCKFRTYTPDKFCEHLQHRHSSNTSHPCNNCSMEFLTPHDLVVHNIKSHDLKLYQCPWCVHGADTENELLGHLSALHPSNQPQAYLRILTYNKDKSNVFKVLPLAFLNKSKVPTEDVIPSIREDPVREAERSVELEKLVGHAKLIVKAANKSTVNDKSSIKTERSSVKDIPVKTLVGQLVATTSHDNIIYKDPALNKKPANTPTEQSACLIVSDSYKDQSPNVTDLFPINKISHEFKKVPLHILYQCPKCRLMCWSMTGLKEHLLLCLNQENITLTCPHCLLVSSSNQTELLAHYEEDHREHDRHECGECGQNFESLKAAKEHIQFEHSVKLHEVITSSQNGIIHYTVCALKRRGQLKRKLSHNEIEATVPKLSCLPQETVSNQLDTGPAKSLYWQCGLCIFKSILRSEVIDHCSEIHKSKMQYKCFYCPFRASSVENIEKHQNNSHVGQEENIFYYYYYQGDVPDEADGTSRWLKQRQMAGITDIGMTTSAMMTKSTPLTITNTIPNPVNASHSVDLNVVKMEVGGDMNSEFECNLEKLCKRFGKFIEPYGLYYFCPLCKVVAKDTIETMRRHLYAELNYKKWGCRLCFYKTCDMKDFRSHMFSAHRTHTTQLPQDPVILPTDIDLENWVRALLDHQTAIIKGIKDNTEQKRTTFTNNTKSSDTVVPTSESISDEKCSEENVACTVGPSGQINNSELLKFLRST